MEEYGHRVQKSVQVYPLSNYTIGVKAPLVEKHASIAERVEALKQSCVLPPATIKASLPALLQGSHQAMTSVSRGRCDGARERPMTAA
jgi:hypothetical protein